ncbi:MAG: SDR family oxidoreductase [Alphaproteobacteria bacterium]|nr:SDR family oxidoreductase [Alphaproteobacteria bacterium]
MMTATFDFSGCAALITGGSNGIGLAIARAFQEAGAEVSITGTKADVADYDEDLSDFSYRQVRLEDSKAVDALIAATERVDVLVNNAGTAVRPPEALTPEGFEKNMDINLNSAFRLCQGLHGKLKSRPGSIINIASMYSYFGSARIPGYGASKAAILQMTKTLAVLYADDDIRVNAIAPGWIETNLTARTRSSAEASRPMTERTPMGRWGKPGEIAGTALYLASDQLAGFVTGVTIPVDGGYSVY